MSFWKKFFGTPEKLPSEIETVNSADDGHGEDNLNETESKHDEQVSELAPHAEKVPEETEHTDSEAVSIEPSFEKHIKIENVIENVDTDVSLEESEEPETYAKTTEQNSSNKITEDESLSAEEILKSELKKAEEAALAAQLEAENKEVFEDLSVLDGRVLPELKVPDWREELDFVKERYEPCDLSDHIVKVSKRRLTARQIDHELAESRFNAYERYLDRATRRFKDKIDEDALLNKVKIDLTQWASEQAKSVAWILADRINDEVVKAKQAEIEATKFVENNAEFTNPQAIEDYKHFSRRIFFKNS